MSWNRNRIAIQAAILSILCASCGAGSDILTIFPGSEIGADSSIDRDSGVKALPPFKAEFLDDASSDQDAADYTDGNRSETDSEEANLTNDLEDPADSEFHQDAGISVDAETENDAEDAEASESDSSLEPDPCSPPWDAGSFYDCSPAAGCGGTAGQSICEFPTCNGLPEFCFLAGEISVLLPGDGVGQCQRCFTETVGKVVLRWAGETGPGWCTKVETPLGSMAMRWRQDDSNAEPVYTDVCGTADLFYGEANSNKPSHAGECVVIRAREAYLVLAKSEFDIGWLHLLTVEETASGCPLSCP